MNIKAPIILVPSRILGINLILISILILIFIPLSSCTNKDLESKLEAAKVKLEMTEKALAEATAKEPGLIHSVFFWLKEDVTEAERTEFVKWLHRLGEIETIKKLHIGPPAATDARGVVDNSFSYALIVHFDDVAGHDVYQTHQTHLDFIEASEGVWTKVIVYDSTVE